MAGSHVAADINYYYYHIIIIRIITITPIYGTVLLVFSW